MADWQPIETAPSEDDVFLAWDGETIHMARMFGDVVFSDTDGEISASHWMPLPPPPATGKPEQVQP